MLCGGGADTGEIHARPNDKAPIPCPMDGE